MDRNFELCLDKLAKDFDHLPWNFYSTKEGYLSSSWLGKEEEDIMVCVMKKKKIHEEFHHQDFFFVNYAFQGNYQALSQKYNHEITIRENECYLAEPYSGYALRKDDDREAVVIGVLLKKHYFYQEFLPILSQDKNLFRFFFQGDTNRFSDEFLHLFFEGDNSAREALMQMVKVYATPQIHQKELLSSLCLPLFLYLFSRYEILEPKREETSLVEKILSYLNEHF